MISIITPCYNSERFIEGCIENVISQGTNQVEHIIVDGKSKDKTVEIIQKYARNYAHIRYLSESDKGQSDAMNKGIKMAKYDTISFLNVDDFYEVGTIEFVKEKIRKLKYPFFLAGALNRLNERDEIELVARPKILNISYIISEWFYKYTNNLFPLNPVSYFYSKSLHEMVGFYDTQDHFCMDVKFILDAISVANCQYTDRILGNWRLIPGSKTFDECMIDSEKANAHFQNVNSIFLKHKNLLIETSLLYRRLDHINYLLKKMKEKILYRFIFFPFVKIYKLLVVRFYV